MRSRTGRSWFTTALEEGELVTEVRFPIPRLARYVKFIQPAFRFALTGVFVARSGSAVRVAVTGASQEGVFRWPYAEEALADHWSAEAVEALEPPDQQFDTFTPQTLFTS